MFSACSYFNLSVSPGNRLSDAEPLPDLVSWNKVVGLDNNDSLLARYLARAWVTSNATSNGNERDFSDLVQWTSKSRLNGSAHMKEMERRLRQVSPGEHETLCSKARCIWAEGFGKPRLSGKNVGLTGLRERR